MKQKTQTMSKESKEFEKYWKLDDYSKITKVEMEDLINLYYKYKDARNKCTAAIFLSHIDNDNRIPPILFDALKYWNHSGYAGWVVTSNARLFNYYPECRNKYLDLMFNGNDRKRDILANSLFFIQEKLRDMDEDELQKVKKKFARKEKNPDLKRIFLFKLNLKKNIKFVNDLVAKYDPLGLIKNGAEKNIYESATYNMYGFYRNNKEKKRKLEIIKSNFYAEFEKFPSDKLLEKMMDEINKKM